LVYYLASLISYIINKKAYLVIINNHFSQPVKQKENQSAIQRRSVSDKICQSINRFVRLYLIPAEDNLQSSEDDLQTELPMTKYLRLIRYLTFHKVQSKTKAVALKDALKF
jgi:hypothetical protein